VMMHQLAGAQGRCARTMTCNQLAFPGFKLPLSKLFFQTESFGVCLGTESHFSQISYNGLADVF
jgi:hypothetical protein